MMPRFEDKNIAAKVKIRRTTPQTQPPADAAQFIVDCATGKHDKPPADIGEMVGRLRARAKQYRTAWGDKNPDLMSEEAADAITTLLTDKDDLVRKLGVLEALISEESIERLAEDIAVACVDCRQEIREARHRAMVRLGERLRKPFDRDTGAALNMVREHG